VWPHFVNRQHELFPEYFNTSNEKEKGRKEMRNERNRAKEARKNKTKTHIKRGRFFIYGGY
jgi:hypothetical protein